MKVFLSYFSCLLLSYFLNTPVGAQPEPAKAAKPSPLKGPLSLSVKGIDETQPSHRAVHYIIRNNTNRAVKAAVFRVEKQPGGTSSLTSYYGGFPGNSVHESVLRVSKKYRTELSIEIDFVLFTDGSTWGSDSLGLSDSVLAHYKGKEAAVEHIKQLVEAGNVNQLIGIFATDLSELEPLMGARIDVMAGRTRRAFLTGYRSAVLTLRRDYQARGIQGITERLKNPNSF